MTEKSAFRIELERRAKAAEVKFAANIGDDTLKERVEAAEAATHTEPETSAQENPEGSTEDVVADEGPAQAEAEVASATETPQPAGPEDAPSEGEDSVDAGGEVHASEPQIEPVTETPAALQDVGHELEAVSLEVPAALVICHKRDGRRRGGRRFPHGETILTEEEITDALVEALRGDPDFTIALRADLDPEA